MSVVALSGSLRTPSMTRLALERVLAAAAAAGLETELVAGAALRLPLCDGGDAPPEVTALAARATGASVLLLGTPEYCGTYSAVIKNAIEWLGPRVLAKKVVAVVSVAVGGSASGSQRALQELALREGAWVIPAQAAVPYAEKIFAAPEAPISRSVLAHLDALGAALPEAIRRLGPRFEAGPR